VRLSKLYSNEPAVFEPIRFVSGLNVVLAEIRLPENRAKDTHNLGKTTLGRLIDFCLLMQRDANFFLFKHEVLFKEFVFLLEIALLDGSFVTIRRSVAEHTKISIKKHAQPDRDYVDLPEAAWDHHVAFEKGKELLDALFDLRDIEPWPYRKLLGYLLRTQDDFRDVFQLRKFAGPHAGWKPFLAHLLGFDSKAIVEHYKKEEVLERHKQDEAAIQRELGGSVGDMSKIEGLLLLKQNEAEKKQRLLDAFDFRQSDKERTKELVDDFNTKIADFNSQRYSLSQNKKKIQGSLQDDEILFDPKSAAELFAEAGVQFPAQLRKDYEQLIAFNKAITLERTQYLNEELVEIEAELKRINAELNTLGKQRSETLSYLTGTDPFAKYKQLTDELVGIKADIVGFEKQRSFLHRLQELRASVRALAEEKEHLQAQIEADVGRQNTDKASLFSTIRVLLSDIVDEVIDRKALLSVAPNQQGHLEFKAEILDESGNATSADLGHTYRKLLCIAFDMALLRAHLEGRYARFVFHDGVFESLDDRKKENLLEVIRAYAQLGLQHIVTLIDSDMPPRPADGSPAFAREEIIVRLHDEDESGRLFKMQAW
jgi:uncharacterized protein YydD (DUF2326 family)